MTQYLCHMFSKVWHLRLPRRRFLFSRTGVWPKFLDNNLKKDIEKFWSLTSYQKDANLGREKFYLLSMIPYPSGNLHMGHVRVYVTSDAIARYQLMMGRNVIFPMGWDSFGLPAENAARQNLIDPQIWTEENINNMKTQLNLLNCNFNWEREIFTSHPDYYKWTQYLFIKMYEVGLAYQKWSDVDWDPVDKTVLAREQVDENGFSWRSGAQVVKKRLKQWFLRTTSFSKALYDDLETLEISGWKDVADIQREWIGPCNGTYVELPLMFGTGSVSDSNLYPTVALFTKTPEIFTRSVPRLILAIKRGHELDRNDLFEDGYENDGEFYFIKLKCQAQNPLQPNLHFPIYVTNLVNYDNHVDATLVIRQEEKNLKAMPSLTELRMGDENESDRLNILQKLRALGLGGYETSARLKDWLVSRQRSWGTSIPMLHCPLCRNVQPVAHDNLPVLVRYRTSYNALPNYASTQNGGAVDVDSIIEKVDIPCNKCGHGHTLPDPDTLDTFVDSTWYFMRFLDPRCQTQPFRKSLTDPAMPVDLYVGGKEHACLHLFFARFMQHFLHSGGFTSHKEPFKNLLMMGQVTNKSYRVISNGKYLHRDQVAKMLTKGGTNLPIETKWEKMSKSKFNGIDPASVVNEHGVDTTRLLVMAEVTPTSPRSWDQQHFRGVLNFQSKLWMTIYELRRQRLNPKEYGQESLQKLPSFEIQIREKANHFLSKVNLYFQQNQLSLVITQLENFCQHLRKYPLSVLAHSGEFEKALAKSLIILATLAPNFALELWAGLKSLPRPGEINAIFPQNEIVWDGELREQVWPTPDRSFFVPCILKSGESLFSFTIPNQTLNFLQPKDNLKVLQLSLANFNGTAGLDDQLVTIVKSWTEQIYNKCNGASLQIEEMDLSVKNADALNDLCRRLDITNPNFRNFFSFLITRFTHISAYPNGGLYLTLDTPHFVFKYILCDDVNSVENGRMTTSQL